MKKFDLHVEYDHSHCDMCGPSFVQGYSLYLNEELLSAVHPYAHCYDEVSCSGEKLFQAVSDALEGVLGNSFSALKYDGNSQQYLEVLQEQLPNLGIQWKVHDYDFGCECDEC